MLRFFVCWLVLTGPVWALEHQRVGVTPVTTHRWDLSADTSFMPYGIGAWNLGVSPHGSYEYAKTWSVSVTRRYFWISDPAMDGLKGEWGPSEFGVGWAGGTADVRLRSVVTVAPPRPIVFELGGTLVRDPVLVGASLEISPPQKLLGVSGRGSIFFQEVINDNLVWSFAFSPEWTRYKDLNYWNISVAWRVSYYEGPYTVGSGISSGSLVPWAWTSSLGRTWDFN